MLEATVIATAIALGIKCGFILHSVINHATRA